MYSLPPPVPARAGDYLFGGTVLGRDEVSYLFNPLRKRFQTLFHFKEYEVSEAKVYLAERGIIVRKS